MPSSSAYTNDANKRALLTLIVNGTSTGANWSASVADGSANYGGYSYAGGSWTVKVAGTTVATASEKSYDFGSGVIASPYFPRSQTGSVTLSPGTYSASATFSGDGSTVGTASVSFSFTVVASTFTVTFSNTNGSNGTTTQTVTSGGTTTFPNPGTRSGYSFDGWLDSTTAIYYSVGATTPTITAAKTFTAVWSIIPEYTYTISYNSNGGTGTMSDTSVTSTSTSQSLTVASNSFSRTGFIFSGWNSSANGTGTSYSSGSTISLTSANSSITLYAQWTSALPVFSDTTITSTGILGINISSNPDTTVSASPVQSYSIVYSGGGSNPTSWLTINNSGQISGIPPAIGIYTFLIRANNGGSNNTDTQTFSITVRPPGKRYSGAGYPDLSLARRFDGSSWIDLTVMKKWDGSSWVNLSN